MTETPLLERPEEASPPAPPAPVRTGIRRSVTGLAFLLVWIALVAPNRAEQLSVASLLRVPIEGLILILLGLFLPARARTIGAAAAGFLLGVLAIAKVLDMGFYRELDRPFNPVTDWGYLGPATGVFRDTYGPGWTRAVEIGAIVLGVALLVLLPLATARVLDTAARHRDRSLRTVGVLGAVWVLSAALGLQVVSGAPIASTATASLAGQQIDGAYHAITDRARFAGMLKARDEFSLQPGGQLLQGLRGKDVIVAFVESYGRVAVQDSSISGAIDAELNAGTRSLAAAGFSARSGFLDSPTFGGISWLAHSTLQSGLWINSQQRYDQLESSNRFTLSDAFKRAGWRTVGDVPSNQGAWPQGKSFYHYDKLYNAHNVGYAGPRFTYATMPDQYILSAFQQRELAQPHRPVMAEIDLVSSHTPWAPLPRMVPWDQVGDGSIYDSMPQQGEDPHLIRGHSDEVTAAYGKSIQYSLHALISFVQNFHDPNLVLLVLGDHQPATTVNGSAASHNVPISLIAHDPAVLDRISSWGWNPGLLPAPNAPVWPMSDFRNRFFSAFGRS